MESKKLRKRFFDTLSENEDLFGLVSREGVIGLAFGEEVMDGAVWIDKQLSGKLGYHKKTELKWSSLIKKRKGRSFQIKKSALGHISLYKHDGNTLDFIYDAKRIGGHILCILRKGPMKLYDIIYGNGKIKEGLNDEGFYVIKTDLNGNYTYVNDYFCERMEIDKDSTIGMNGLVHIIPEDHHKCGQVVEQCLAKPDIPHRVVLRKPEGCTGRFITNEWEFILLTDQDGVPIEFLCIGHDINLSRVSEQGIKRIQFIIENSHNGVVISDGDLKVKWKNPRFISLTGYDPEEIRKEDFLEWFLGHGIHDLKKGNAVIPTLECKRKDGSQIWLSVDLFPYIDGELGYKGYILMFKDISEVYLNNKLLVNTNTQLELAIKTANLGIWHLNVNDGLLSWNDNLLEIYGLAREEFEKHPDQWRSLVFDKDLSYADGEFGKIFEGKEVSDVHFRIRQKSTNEIRYILASGSPIKNERGIVEELIGINIDITDIIGNEEALRESRERLELSIEGAGLGLWDWYVQTGKTVFNQRWANIIGYELEELEPINIDTWISNCHPDDLEKSNKLLKEHFNGKTSMYICEARMRHKKGHWVWVLDCGRVFEWTDDGKPLRMTGIHLDITERVLGQQELQTLLDRTAEQNERLMGYSYIVSHNLRSAVASIKGLYYLLRDDPGDRLLLDKLGVSAEKLDIAIANMNELLYLEDGVLDKGKRRYELNGSLKKIIELNSRAINEKKAEIKVVVQGIISMDTIPAYIDSIFENLLSNALKYGVTHNSKTILFSLEEKEENILIKVSDKGLGMDLNRFGNKLFELGSRFHQIAKGFGMGLYMIKRQVELLGGHIDVESQEGVGTTFTVELNKAL